ncbi:MAG: hypothetical protein H6667_02870 [Ardenticatenaceae bacterium]|nr:hypothetical protein [Ardenticatenaceae bacterium]MCB9442952.1 hypothetical protein [Ardenticatenaceae bacterium]
MDLLQLIGVNLNAFIQNPIIAILLAGAAEGVVVGLVTGTLVWSINKAPDALGRALLFAVIFALVGLIAEVVRILSLMGFSMGQMIETINENPAIGIMFLNALIRTSLYLLLGALVGVASRAPQFMVRGMVVGILLGGGTGALLKLITNYYFGFSFHILIFRLLIALGVWGGITVISSNKS